jgi:transcriptional regulator with XRE-family HTH domain
MSNLKEYRRRAGLTQAQVAARTGIAEATVNRYENEKRYPDVLTALKIADVLKVKDLRKIWSGNSLSQV